MGSTQLSPRTLARLKAALQRRGITQERVATEATKTARRGTVGKTAVSHALSGRYKSANVIATARRLLAESDNGKAAVA